MFTKILIANRGEIACRIGKTAHRMGIATVAVYADADARSLHVQMADEALPIGASPSGESYLRSDRILHACQASGAQAVHPGYGFLSENAEFAAALAAQGITFIGPQPPAIAAMGDKIQARKLAAQAGVNIIPGHNEALQNADQARAIAEQIGFPVMIKASAGGGGKGMRIAWSAAEVADGFRSASSEARDSFADERVFIEKYLASPRHIEIQILADQHGACLHLGERECSIQRRHQKVIEEAPSPLLDAVTRQAMGEQAVALARAVDYCSAGTVEFIVDQQRNFYFLEMNTRLQVEHPVTECVTGLDIVEQMIRIAANEPLTVRQQDLELKGWALEARVYAENPERGFMPSSGRITHHAPPAESASVRVDTGVYEGGEISVYYDPLIAKLITCGTNRAAAIRALEKALDDYLIRGVAHNMDFLAALIRHDDFIRGDLSTDFIDRHYPDGFSATAPHTGQRDWLLALAASMQHQIDHRAAPGEQCQTREYQALVGDYSAAIRSTRDAPEFVVLVGDHNYRLTSDWQPGRHKIHATINGRAQTAQVEREAGHWLLTAGGLQTRVAMLRPRVAELYRMMPQKVPPDTSGQLLSPLPGLLVRLCVAVGDRVQPGQGLAVVQAMKMENTLTAERAGIVSAISVERGDNLAVGQTIMEFDPLPTATPGGGQ